jgi:hypothetical protein
MLGGDRLSAETKTWNQGIEINPSAVLPQKCVIRGVGLNEADARISDDLPAVV